MMCGEEHGGLGVTTVVRYLKGTAGDQFFARVAVPGSSIPYKFEELAIEMAPVFLTFESVWWSTDPPKRIQGTV